MGKLVDTEEFIEKHSTIKPNFERTGISTTNSPIGLRTRSIVNSIRIKEIADAIKRYTDASKVIPQDWIDELSELNSMVV